MSHVVAIVSMSVRMHSFLNVVFAHQFRYPIVWIVISSKIVFRPELRNWLTSDCSLRIMRSAAKLHVAVGVRPINGRRQVRFPPQTARGDGALASATPVCALPGLR